MEALIAAGVLGVSALFFILAGEFPILIADPGGLALVPRIVAVFTGAASLLFLIQTVLKQRHMDRVPAAQFLRTAGAEIVRHRREILSFVLVGALPFLIQWLGFMPAIAVFTALLLTVFSVPWLPLVLTTTLTTASIYVAYAIALGAVLPVGSLWN